MSWMPDEALQVRYTVHLHITIGVASPYFLAAVDNLAQESRSAAPFHPVIVVCPFFYAEHPHIFLPCHL